MISMTDHEATRPTFVRTRLALHEPEAKTRCYKAEAEKFGLEATLVIECYMIMQHFFTLSKLFI